AGRGDEQSCTWVGRAETTALKPQECGARLERGPWKPGHQNAPRHFVMAEPTADKTLVYWGTPKVKEALDVSEWPRGYRERNAIQALSFKSMIAHGGLEINHGRKTILGPDRHHQSKQEQLESSLDTGNALVTKNA